jgi:amino acid transporter
MAQDKEMPEVMGLLHGKYATPHMGVWIMAGFCAIVGSIGVIGGGVTLTAVALASNLGTFILYAMICIVTIAAFMGTKEFHGIRHALIPVLGLIANVVMVAAIIFLNITTPGTQQATLIALGIAVVWFVISVAYFIFNSRQQGKAILPSASAMAKTS